MTTNEIMPTMPLTPANQNEMFGGAGGSWLWIFLIFILLAGGGLGGLGGANAATNAINNDFLYTQSKIDSLSQALINQTNQLNQTSNAGFSSVNQAICGIGHQIDNGLCGVNRNIDQVRFENAQNTCEITNVIRDEGRLTRDLINSNVMQDLRDRNLELATALNNSAQTAAIVNAVRPYPQAAYLTANPQASYGYPGFPPVPFGGGCGHNPCNPCCA